MTPSASESVSASHSEWIASNESAFAIWDADPVTPGHALILTRRHVSDWWQTTPQERHDLLELVGPVRARIDPLYSPDGYHIRIDVGIAAGQVLDRVHVHVIPRYVHDGAGPHRGVGSLVVSPGSAGESFAHGEGSTHVLVDGRVRLLLPELTLRLRQPEFDRIDIAVSFIKSSGLNLLIGPISDALQRGARIRILTTDYLGLTEATALTRLLDLSEDHASLEVRVFHDREVSFHPKAYLFYSSTGKADAAIVGSSNLTKSGLDGGIEWNLRVGAIDELRTRFSELWHDDRSLPLSEDLIDTYEPAPAYAPGIIDVADEPDGGPEPRPIQAEALKALEQTRAEGFRAGMVTMATGLGKTWLAAFDVAQSSAERALFIAHRDEILRQSRDVFRQVMPEVSMGFYTGAEKSPDARIVFASVQTLARNIGRFAPDEFDYIVVDEFHHAAAVSYRKVLDHFSPKFLLGLTATPERMDGADLLALCADNLVFHCDLVEGIKRNELVPFQYWGVPDTVDFEPIPWRNGRFDPEALETAVETQERAQAAFDEWRSRCGSRTLAFCVTKHHADFMAEFFRARGVRCASVHSGPTSAPRFESIEALRDGRLQVIFAVDIFNEGLDVPDVDTILMLRPTASPVIFLQQLGRGLRVSSNKERLTVIDFIGNHRSFLLKPRVLLSLTRAESPTTMQVLAALESGDFGLPPGCAVNYELTVVDMLKRLARTTTYDAIEEYCRSHYEEEGHRPTAVQAFHAGHDVPRACGKHEGWFRFLRALDLLDDTELAVVEECGDVLRAFETEDTNKCYKLVTIRALIHDGTLRAGSEIAANAETSRKLLLADPRLAREIPEREFPDLAGTPLDRWTRYWRKWPLTHLTKHKGKSSPDGVALFRIDGDMFLPNFAVPDYLGEAFDAMVSELIEYRLAFYLRTEERKRAPRRRPDHPAVSS